MVLNMPNNFILKPGRDQNSVTVLQLQVLSLNLCVYYYVNEHSSESS